MNQRPPEHFYYGNNQHMSNPGNMLYPMKSDSMADEAVYETPFVDFIDAIKNQNFQHFKHLLTKHPDFANKVDTTSKQTPVFFACLIPNEEIALMFIRELLNAGADPKYFDPIKQNVMFYIARDGKIKLFEFFLSLGVTPNIVDQNLQTPLFYASREGRLDICRRLVDLGANVNQIDFLGQNCLFYSASRGHLEISELLVENGINHKLQDFNKETAMMWAKKEKKPAVLKFLKSLESGGAQKPRREVSSQSDVRSQTPKEVPLKKKPSAFPFAPKERDDSKAVYKLVFISGGNTRVDVTESEFSYFKQNHPELADYLMDPSRIPVGGATGGPASQKSDKNDWEKAANRILSHIWKVKGANIFHYPVDPVKLGIHDYFSIIKNPMDFGTIKKRLKSNYYTKLQDFIGHVKLVFYNCTLYNGTGSEVGRTCLAVQDEFEKACVENNAEQIIQEQIKDEVKSEVATENKNAGEPQNNTFNINDGFMGDDLDLMKQGLFPDFNEEISKIEDQ